MLPPNFRNTGQYRYFPLHSLTQNIRFDFSKLLPESTCISAEVISPSHSLWTAYATVTPFIANIYYFFSITNFIQLVNAFHKRKCYKESTSIRIVTLWFLANIIKIYIALRVSASDFSKQIKICYRTQKPYRFLQLLFLFSYSLHHIHSLYLWFFILSKKYLLQYSINPLMPCHRILIQSCLIVCNNAYSTTKSFKESLFF